MTSPFDRFRDVYKKMNDLFDESSKAFDSFRDALDRARVENLKRMRQCTSPHTFYKQGVEGWVCHHCHCTLADNEYEMYVQGYEDGVRTATSKATQPT